ncbi:unnamed protein product, partial [Nesidiocoris tenuis]
SAYQTNGSARNRRRPRCAALCPPSGTRIGDRNVRRSANQRRDGWTRPRRRRPPYSTLECYGPPTDSINYSFNSICSHRL